MNKKPTWTILLIDAQPMSRNTLKSQLEYYRYDVLLADSARSSLQTFQQQQRNVDLVVIDLGLKDAPATKVIEILRKLSPDLKIIGITEQTLTDSRDELAGTVGVLRRPVRSDRLMALISMTLGRI